MYVMVVGKEPKNINDGKIEALFYNRDIAYDVCSAWNNENEKHNSLVHQLANIFNRSHYAFNNAVIFELPENDEADICQLIEEKYRDLVEVSNIVENLKLKYSIEKNNLDKQISDRENRLNNLNLDIKEKEYIYEQSSSIEDIAKMYDLDIENDN